MSHNVSWLANAMDELHASLPDKVWEDIHDTSGWCTNRVALAAKLMGEASVKQQQANRLLEDARDLNARASRLLGGTAGSPNRTL